MNTLKVLTICCLLTISNPITRAADETGVVSLLQGKNSRLVQASDSGLKVSSLGTLYDGKPDPSVEFELESGIPLDLIWALPETVTCDELVVTADARRLTTKQLPRVEVLVSTLSGQSGFQTIRSFVLKASDQPQSLKLPGSAARWILVRLTTPAETTVVAVSEIAVNGQVGPPQSRYAFKEAPAKAFSVLSEVQKSVQITISDDERSLYQDAADGKLDDWSFAEAALVSSGVDDADKRRKLLEKIDELTAGAKAALGDEASSYARAEGLLKWLHENAMSVGYEENQTDLATVLETGRFNCVSSATLYNIVGRRLGLDLRAIEVPDHAFSILYVGSKHADVETTNALGFNPARDPRILQRFKEQTGFRYIPDRHADKRREVSDRGLLALTCYNHGVFHMLEKNYPEALADYFRALSLDPELTSAIQNVIGVFANWSRELAEDAQFEQAVTVVSTGLRLAPEDQSLLHNRKVAWQQWARAEIEADRRQSALSVLRNAAKASPGDGFDQMQAYVFLQPGEKLAETQKWTEALALAAKGLTTVAEVARKDLREWRKGVYHRWTDAELNRNDFVAATDVLTRAMRVEPDDRKFPVKTAYVMQEWLNDTEKSSGLAAAEKLLRDLNTRFNMLEPTRQVTDNFIVRAAQGLMAEKRSDEALDLVDRTARLMSINTARDLQRMIFDQQAGGLVEEKQWQEAIAVYTNALKSLPEDGHLRNNLQAMWDMWAGTFHAKAEWSKAAEVYAMALDSGISNSTFARKLGYCVQELALTTLKSDSPAAAEKQIADWQRKRPEVREIGKASMQYVQTVLQQHQKVGEHAKALAAADRCRSLVDDAGHQRLVRIVCDTWAQRHSKKMEWTETLAVYSQGLKSRPKDSHLIRNAAAIWNTWAGTHIDRKEWAEAIAVYDQGLKQFPNDGTLRNNRQYCQQQVEKQ